MCVIVSCGLLCWGIIGALLYFCRHCIKILKLTLVNQKHYHVYPNSGRGICVNNLYLVGGKEDLVMIYLVQTEVGVLLEFQLLFRITIINSVGISFYVYKEYRHYLMFNSCNIINMIKLRIKIFLISVHSLYR